MSKLMKKLLIVLGVIVALSVFAGTLSAVLTDPQEPPAAAPAVAEVKPGSPAVYERIAAMSDCDLLQNQFDTAMDSVERGYQGGWTIAYADAADARMRAIGCYA